MRINSLPCDFKTFSIDDDDKKLKVKLRVVHEGRNLNATKLSLPTINNAESSLYNIPILGFVKYDENDECLDFDGHNMITKIVETPDGYGVEYKFLERPLGVIPSDTEISYVEENGKIYLECTGLVWKHYNNHAYQLLMESDSKSVSMEIEIEDGEFDEKDGYYNITKFKFLGITILGDDVPPGIEGANITKYSNFNKYKEAVYDICKEMYSAREEEKALENNKETFEEVVEEVVEDEVKSEVEKEEIVEEEQLEEADVEETTEEPKEEVEEEQLEEEYSLDLSKFSEILDEVPQDVEGLFTAVSAKIGTLNEELTVLREFKEMKDLETLKEDMNNIISEFNLEKEQYGSFEEKVISKEMSLEDFRKELSLLDYNRLKAQMEQFSANQVKEEKAVINFSAKLQDEVKDENEKSYAKLIKEYSNK